jgi:hypothetical protein
LSLVAALYVAFSVSSTASSFAASAPISVERTAEAMAGGRRFAVTAIGIRYNLQTGADQGTAKLRLLLMAHRSGDQASGTAILEIFAPDGTPSGPFQHAVTFTRIRVEPVD